MATLLLPVAAVVAGTVSFTSPCCLPLIPGYLSYISALPVSQLGTVEARTIALKASIRFVAGFTVVFTALGVSFALVGSALLRRVPLILQASGVLIIAMGLATIGVLRLPILHREKRIDLARVPSGPGGAFFLGMAFAFGWAPCIGPILATILAAAAATRTAAWGALLLACYSVGLGLPFIGLALGIQRARGSLEWLKRHGRAIETVGGVLLVAVGLLFVTGHWRAIFLPLQRRFARLGWPPI
jgi:cytochrome c-type biogenesis protein